MRLRDREDRGFPSPLLLSYTSSSFLPSLPCRCRLRWQGDADTSQSLPLSDERLLPPSRLTLLFSVCLTFLAVLFLSHISFCLVFCFSWWTFPFYFFLFGQYFIIFGGFLSNHSSLLFLRMIEIVMMRDCHDVGKSYDNSLYGAHWFNHHRQKLALLKAKMHRVNTFGAIRQSLKGWWEEDTLGHASTFSFCTVTFHFSMTQNMREGSFRMIKQSLILCTAVSICMDGYGHGPW